MSQAKSPDPARSPILLVPCVRPCSWGTETWLNSTQADGRAGLRDNPDQTLASLITARPELLGKWARRFFGDDAPIFTKFLKTHFPPLVHMGFRERVDRELLLDLLGREQALLRRFRGALAIADERMHRRFQVIHAAWAIEQALRGWTIRSKTRHATFVRSLLPFVASRAQSGRGRAELTELLAELREGRAQFVALFNEADLREEADSLLLSEAGVAHAIFGLSHQTHPIDRSRAALEELIVGLRSLASRGASEDELDHAASKIDLAALRAANLAPPKSEAWMPLLVRGKVLLVEPQQTSNTTLSFADFYTPFSFDQRTIFRKGDPEGGLDERALRSCVDSLRLEASSFDEVRRRPVALDPGPGARNARLSCLVDEPSAWPFFTVHRIDLDGSARGEASFEACGFDGAFQELVTLEEGVELEHEGATYPLSASSPAFLPATMSPRYLLRSRRKARIFLFSVPVPRGNDPAFRPASVVIRAVPNFLDREAVPLQFGTSGLRGLVADITDLEAYINTAGFLRYLVQIGDVAVGSQVLLGGDLRPSTDRIVLAVARAVAEAGFSPVYAGKLPTPALTYHAIKRGIASIMVTGSHIPFDRNGIKFNKRSGEVLKGDETGILARVAEVRRVEYAKDKRQSSFDSHGMWKLASSSLAIDDGARRAYVRRYLDVFDARSLAGLRVAVYQHSAVGRELLPTILEGLGAEVVALGLSDVFVPIDTENVTQEQLDRLFAIADHGARTLGRVDAIVSTDGDSDRPLVAAVNDDGVRFLSGDLLGLVVATFLGVDAAAVPVSVNDAVDIELGLRSVRLAKTKIGSPYVIEALDRLRAEGFQRVVGWEANGGFMCATDLVIGDRVLEALPTRDAVLPIIAALIASRGGGLAQRFAKLPARFSKAGLLDDFPLDVSRALLERFSPADPRITEIDFGPLGARTLETEGTWLALDRDSAEAALDAKRALEVHFQALGEIVWMSFVDGIRMRFSSGDIGHVRPSGNAPQLRFYAVGSTQSRADELVASAIAEPKGLLRALASSLRSDS